MPFLRRGRQDVFGFLLAGQAAAALDSTGSIPSQGGGELGGILALVGQA
jgi:hypothetical protein